VKISFSVETFAASSSVETLNSLKKNELLQLLEHYSLTASTSMGKSQIKQIVLTHLLEEIIPLSEVTDEITREKSSMTGEELLQLKCLEMEERDEKRKAKYRMKELELREKEFTFKVKLEELEAKVDRSIMGRGDGTL